MFLSRRGPGPNQANHHKHMDYLQTVIGRLAGNSFLLKGWCVTLTVALMGFAFTREEPALAALGVVATVALWIVDAYFLRWERGYRDLFREVAAGRIGGFLMDASSFAKVNLWRIAFRGTLAFFYGPLTLIGVLVAIYLTVAVGGPIAPDTAVCPGSGGGSVS